MDQTLREYLMIADAAHEYIDKFGIALHTDKLEEKVQQLQINIKNIQSVAKRIADVSNIINQIILHKKAIIPINNIRTLSPIDPYPTANDHAVLRTIYPLKQESKTIIDDISIPVKIVEDVSHIPINNIYYINSLKQYAINIAGVVIKGNLSNIVEYQTEKSARCEYGTECKSFKKLTNCSYYHDPEDYIKLNLPVPNHIRNFTVGSWIYSKSKRPKTYFTRHIGNRKTLLYDLSLLKTIQYREEISNREGQLIHDLLIYLILHNKGLLERYPHWISKVSLTLD
jgi:hypothetical protein